MEEDTEDLAKIISENMQFLMKKYNVSPADLAHALEVSQATISYWINGKKVPRGGAIQKMSNYFRVSKKEILVSRDERDREERTILSKVNLIQMIDSAEMFGDKTLTDSDKEFIKSVTRLYLNSKQK